MFGVLKTSGCGWNCRLRNEWAGHLCGTCLALGQEVGQTARLATNYDGALLSALADAQSVEPAPRIRHFCSLRGFRHATVVAPAAPAAQYAAAISTLMVATKVDDHVTDGDGFVAWAPKLFGDLARRARAAARHLARLVGFDTTSIETAVADQGDREAQTGRDFLFYSEPTERALAAAFVHTAEVAGRPENRPLLAELGALFGRLMLLFDSYRDLAADRAKGHFNALDAAADDGHVEPLAHRLFHDARERIGELVPRLDLVRPHLVEHLLVAELGGVGELTLGLAAAVPRPVEESPKRRSRWGGRHRDGDTWICCCCPCDCCGCTELCGGCAVCEVCACAECCC